MNVDKQVERTVTYNLQLSHREMEILSVVAQNTVGRGDARFLYDLGGLYETDDDLPESLCSDIEVSFDDVEHCGMQVTA